MVLRNTCIVSGAAVLLVMGTIMLAFREQVLYYVIRKELQLRPGSKLFTMWSNPPVRLDLQLWVFNVTNPKEASQGKSVNVQQMGPYTYRISKLKHNITWGEDSLNYSTHLYYYYHPDTRHGSPETDQFTAINLPLLGMATILEDLLPSKVQEILGRMMEVFHQSLFRQYNVHQYLWGYEDPFYKEVKVLLKKFGFTVLADLIPDTFGLFPQHYGNGSTEGLWSVHTNENQLNLIKSWNNTRLLPYWWSDSANMINGTDGSFWPPFTNTNELNMFLPQICRSLKFTIQHDHYTKHGVHLQTYNLPLNTLASGTTDPQNLGFCTHNCLPNGLLNLSTCSGGPVVLSFPHFLGAASEVSQSVDGLNATPDLQSTIHYEQLTGAGMESQIKLQFNTVLQPYSLVRDTESLNRTFLPTAWMNVSGSLTSEEIWKDCKVLQMIDTTSFWLGLTLIVLGFSLLIGLAAHLCSISKCHKKNSTESETLLIEAEQ